MTDTPQTTPTNELDIETLAGLQFSAPELAVILGEDMPAFLSAFGYSRQEAAAIAARHSAQTEVYRAVQRGRLLQEAKVRQSIAAMGQAGSNPAQALYLKLKSEREINEKLSR